MISRFIGPILGILSFSIAIFSGLVAGLPITTILTRALWAMMIFCFLGTLIGWVAQMAVNDHLRARKLRFEQMNESAESKDATPPMNAAAKATT